LVDAVSPIAVGTCAAESTSSESSIPIFCSPATACFQALAVKDFCRQPHKSVW
jgi:hypothetical protein